MLTQVLEYVVETEFSVLVDWENVDFDGKECGEE